MNASEWRDECAHISNLVASVTRSGNVPAEFNGDPACLARYLEMQRNSATREGFHVLAGYIQECADDLLLYRLGVNLPLSFAYLEYCEARRDATSDPKLREFWQRLAGSVRKAAAL